MAKSNMAAIVAARNLIHEMQEHIAALEVIASSDEEHFIKISLANLRDNMPQGGQYAGRLVVGDGDEWDTIFRCIDREEIPDYEDD